MSRVHSASGFHGSTPERSRDEATRCEGSSNGRLEDRTPTQAQLLFKRETLVETAPQAIPRVSLSRSRWCAHRCRGLPLHGVDGVADVRTFGSIGQTCCVGLSWNDTDAESARRADLEDGGRAISGSYPLGQRSVRVRST